MKLLHGGDWAGYQEEYGALPLDFSANLSPLGMPDGVRRAAEAAIRDSDRYPDPACRTLCAALAEKHGVPAENIVCGNGAADLIEHLPQALRPGRALLPIPTFSEYGTALENAGCAVEHFPLRKEIDFALTEELLSRIVPGLDLLLLCNPNNPTGRTAEPALLRALLKRCGETGTVLAVDECFCELTEEPSVHSLTGELSSHNNLILLRAFTKSHAMAGLRLGYALCGSGELANHIRRCMQPWPVSVPAQAAGLAALKEEAYLERLRQLLSSERPYLAAGLGASGCRVIPSDTNFILFYHEDVKLCEKLRKKGILLRSCRNFEGLGPGWYRTAVRSRRENELLLTALKEVLNRG